jgi:hypothetical protein
MAFMGAAVHWRSHAAQPRGWSAIASITMAATQVVRKGLESVYQVGPIDGAKARFATTPTGEDAGRAEHPRPARLAADYGAGETWTGQV